MSAVCGQSSSMERRVGGREPYPFQELSGMYHSCQTLELRRACMTARSAPRKAQALTSVLLSSEVECDQAVGFSPRRHRGEELLVGRVLAPLEEQDILLQRGQPVIKRRLGLDRAGRIIPRLRLRHAAQDRGPVRRVFKAGPGLGQFQVGRFGRRNGI